MSWRVNWALRQFVDLSGYRKHARVLRHSSQFYRGLLFKLVPGVISKPLNLALRDGYTIQIHEFMTLFIYKEIFVDCCYDLALGRHEPVIVDIGANTGLFALRMKQLYPESRITCYEPFPPNFAKLKRLIELNHLESVVPVLKAVGARDGNVRL